VWMAVTYYLFIIMVIYTHGTLCGVYLDSYAAKQLHQLPSFTDVVGNTRYRSDSVLNQINPVPTFKHVLL
jgi:hypothetical protein